MVREAVGDVGEGLDRQVTGEAAVVDRAGELGSAELRGAVERGPGRARDPQSELDGEVAALEAFEEVSGDPGGAPVGGDVDVERLVPSRPPAPDAACRAVAERRARAAGENGGRGLLEGRAGWAADAIDARVDGEQAPGLDPVRDLGARKSGSEELGTGDIAVLAVRECGDQGVLGDLWSYVLKSSNAAQIAPFVARFSPATAAPHPTT